MKIEGIYPPLITPFDEEGRVDERRLLNLIEFLRPHVQGLFVCGSYGSGPLLPAEEREQVYSLVAATAGKALPWIAHVGAADTATTLRLARSAEHLGAAAVSAVPPYYYTHTPESVREHYLALLRAVSLPVYAYDNPKTTGNPLSPALLDELAENGLAGVKDSSFDIGKLYLSMRTVRRRDFDFVIGSESLLLPAFVMGVRGCISGLANAFPEAMQKLYQAALSGSQDEARAWQERILKLWDVLHIGPTVPTVHAILKLRGIDAGFPRRPLLPLGPEAYARVAKELKVNTTIFA
jgi:dihydrodipicolinate synthase/N-acetylneuraminate lyase